ncbi:MAG TPA: DNA-binding protein [Thermoanaerobaculia bacterium]
MKRTPLYLDADTAVVLRLESMRRQQPMAEIIREALQSYLRREPRQHPPGRGEFRSGRKDIAERAEEFLRGAAPGIAERIPS